VDLKGLGGQRLMRLVSQSLSVKALEDLVSRSKECEEEMGMKRKIKGCEIKKLWRGKIDKNLGETVTWYMIIHRLNGFYYCIYSKSRQSRLQIYFQETSFD
jgi:hypothetical protein